ncbi:MAG: dTDP-4-dehydrorhamnose reductase [Stygiobacter sp.]|nr:MAG: dTDP-4-dehydrorhamnose reductase [Stygiobacter sp.]
MLSKVLVTGANGQLGSQLKEICGTDPNYLFTDINELNILDRNQVSRLFNSQKIDFVINCAVYTAVDKAESEPELAEAVNATAVKNLVDGCKINDSKIIHISTDFVFNGMKSSPYTETDIENPLSIYGKSKLNGEMHLRNSYDKYIILRSSWLYSKFGNNFVKTIIRLAKEKEEIGVVFDQIGTPTYAGDLAIFIKYLVDSNFSQFGVYNYSNEGTASWYDFARSILEYSNLNLKIRPIETNEYLTPARRPSYSVLNKSKTKATFGVEIAYWRTSLQRLISKMIGM